MTLQTESDLRITQEKLREVEKLYDELRAGTGEPAPVREASLTSLKRVINQLKEEIARYETRQPAPRSS